MREMKNSGVEWIGEIPKHWSLKKIKYLVEFIQEKAQQKDSNKQYLALENIESWTGKYIETESDYETEGALLCNKDDVIFGKLRPYLAKTMQVERNSVCSSEFAVMRGKMLLPRFLNYLARSDNYISIVNAGAYGTKMPRANIDQIGNLSFPLPPASEQVCISLFLDAKCAEIDSISEDIRKEIETLQEYRKSVITEVVTKGLDPNVKMKDSGVEWIGEIPDHWNILPFKSQFILSKGLNITKADLVDEGIPVVSYGQIHAKYCDGVHLLERQLRYLPTTRVFPETCITKKDDIVFADTSEDKEGTGNAVRNSRDDKVFAGYHTIIARPKNITDTRYMSYQFKTLEWRSQLIRYEAVKVYSITQNLLNRTSLIVPPLSVQLLISDHLDSKCAEINSIIADKQKQLDILAEYRKSLIYEYVTGKKEVV